MSAAELVESAIVTGHEGEAVEAARRLLHPDLAARIAIQMQAAGLLVRTGYRSEVPDTLRTPRAIDAQTCRALARANPLDPIAWVELSLQQTVRRQVRAAKRSMSLALHLAPHNRHVLRSAARLYLHDGDPERAHDLLFRNSATAKDPWLMSAEIAMAGLAGRVPRLMKTGSHMLDDRAFSPGHITELAGAIATVHLIDGNRKKSRRMFASSMQDPTGNALAQGEWAAIMAFGDIVPVAYLQTVHDAHEAEAMHYYRLAHFERVPSVCLKWAEEDPFSIRPFELAAVTANHAGLHQTAIEMARKGLEFRSHPFNLQQSLVYALASNGDIEEAESELATMRDGGDQIRKALMTANQGLIEFRRGEHKKGTAAYRESIEILEQNGQPYYAALASLYLAKESMRAHIPNADGLLGDAETLLKSYPRSEGAMLLKKIKVDRAHANSPSLKPALTEQQAKAERLRSLTWTIEGMPKSPQRLIR